ncbi:MAG: histidine phosphatase family protein [Anaerolineae bacterium]
MKTILILRHAKSDWSDPLLADFDRPLARRGLKDAPRMGTVLADFDCLPDAILSSPARRARQTAELAAEACGFRGTIQWHDSFYGAAPQTLLNALRRLPNHVSRPMLVGHNPTMEETVAMLLSAGDALSIRMPTAALACLEVSVSGWQALQPGQAMLRWFLIPKLVKALR